MCFFLMMLLRMKRKKWEKMMVLYCSLYYWYELKPGKHVEAAFAEQ